MRRGDWMCGKWRRCGFLVAFSLLPCLLLAQASDDVVLRAMRDELNRSRGLKVVNLETPYYLRYTIEDADMFAASATLGGLVSVRHERIRVPDVQARVGDYKFDNTNYAGAGFQFGSRYDISRFPLEDNYAVLRRFLWLATDGAYKSAVESISRKRAALRNVAASEHIDDFAKAAPVRLLKPIAQTTLNEDEWTARVRTLSAAFAKFPELKDSSVEFQAVQSVEHIVTSEGSEIRTPGSLAFIRARASIQAPDGMVLGDSIVFHTLALKDLAPEPELIRGIETMAQNVRALSKAPLGEDYNGPILFEGVAAAQLFAQLLGKNLALTRRPVMEPGRGGAFPASELEGRQGTRILPEWMDVVDDPTQTEWRGRPLFGSYDVDREGVAPRPLSLVEKGVLKGFLLTRQPVRGFEGSNGRARLPGLFGAEMAGISNLFVRASETVTATELRKQMMEICRNRNKPYGIVVRKMNYPATASLDQIRQLLARAGGSMNPASLPVLVYRVYADGREELVRGLRFGTLNTRSLKDILAAGDDSNVFEFLDNTAPLALAGAGGYVSEACVIAPSVLIDDLELRGTTEQLPKPPVVPAPELTQTLGR